jgi:glycosyltransferase involved in cell wall biosynthesis
MKVALVHDWLTGIRGGERCLEVFCELFPQADIYTLLHIPGTVSPIIERHPIHTSFLQRLPAIQTAYRYYLPLFPRAIESFQLPACDLILSSSHCVAKGIRPPPGAKHLCYIHSPMRYVWDQFENYARGGRSGLVAQVGLGACRTRLQAWDVTSANRVDQFIANSRHIAEKVRRYYGRSASVLHPPVDWGAFQIAEKSEDFYLMVTAFAPYKRVDLAIQACHVTNRRLKLIGKGQEEARLRKLAGPTVEFLGWQPDNVVQDHYKRCRGLLFPGEEDFGIVPLEVMASGRPVIAYGRGGALETVVPLNPPTIEAASRSVIDKEMSSMKTPTVTGVFFYEQSVGALVDAIELFESREREFSARAIRAHVKPFDRAHFKEQMSGVIAEAMDKSSTVIESC